MSCTCHPDDNPPRPCPERYALSECRAAAGDQVEAVALAIHKARFAHPTRPREPDPFTDRSDREYAFRLARAAIAALTTSPAAPAAETVGELPEITMQMWSAGVEAFKAWDPDEEDSEAMVASVFWAMHKASLPSAEAARIAELEESLQPFAEVFDKGWGSRLPDDFEMNVSRSDLKIIGCRIPVGAFRRARDLLSRPAAAPAAEAAEEPPVWETSGFTMDAAAYAEVGAAMAASTTASPPSAEAARIAELEEALERLANTMFQAGLTAETIEAWGCARALLFRSAAVQEPQT